MARSERTAQATDLAKVFKALADPTRLAIFELVRTGGRGRYTEREVEQSVSEIASHFHVSLSTVSHHLKELRNAGLIRCDKRGQTVYCSCDPEVLGLVGRFAQGPRT